MGCVDYGMCGFRGKFLRLLGWSCKALKILLQRKTVVLSTTRLSPESSEERPRGTFSIPSGLWPMHMQMSALRPGLTSAWKQADQTLCFLF